MALIKCPKCELNYIKEDEKVCEVCKASSKNLVKKTPEKEHILCTECGDQLAVPGKELCIFCLSEKKKLERMERQALDSPKETLLIDDEEALATLEMDTIEDIPEDELEEIDEELDKEDLDGFEDEDMSEENEVIYFSEDADEDEDENY